MQVRTLTGEFARVRPGFFLARASVSHYHLTTSASALCNTQFSLVATQVRAVASSGSVADIYRRSGFVCFAGTALLYGRRVERGDLWVARALHSRFDRTLSYSESSSFRCVGGFRDRRYFDSTERHQFPGSCNGVRFGVGALDAGFAAFGERVLKCADPDTGSTRFLSGSTGVAYMRVSCQAAKRHM